MRQYREDRHDGPLEDHPVIQLLSMRVGGNLTGEISGRTLYKYLGISKDYSSWMADRLAKCSLVEGRDYRTQWFKSGVNGHSLEHVLTQMAAIEIVIMSRSKLSYIVCRSVLRRDGVVRLAETVNVE